MSRPPLSDYQAEGVEFLRGAGRALLADEPGLGKSRQAIEASEGKTLVLAPAMVINGGTWWDEDADNPGEIQKWADDPGRFTVVPYSSINARVPAGTSKTGQTIYKPSPRELAPIVQGRWDTLICDESHYIKGRKTTWTLATQIIAKSTGDAYLMTGTPFPNWAHELFTTLQVIYPEKAKPGKELGSYWRWAGRYFDTSPTQFSNGMPSIGDMLACDGECYARPVWDPCQHWLTMMQENMPGHYLRRTRDEVLDLPPITTQIEYVPMVGEQLKQYRSMKRDYVAEVDGLEVVTWSTGSRNVALDRITTSLWNLNPVGPPKGGKYDLLRFDLENRSRPTLVVAHYQQTVEACAAVAQGTGARVGYVHGGVTKKAADDAIRGFKAGRLDVLVGSLDTVAEGLNLQMADMVIFVESSYKPYRNEQARQRVHRRGQERPVTVRDYRTPDSVDSRKHALLAVKNDRQMRALSAAEFAALL